MPRHWSWSLISVFLLAILITGIFTIGLPVTWFSWVCFAVTCIITILYVVFSMLAWLDWWEVRKNARSDAW